jgi:hypothetical protein
MAPETVEVSAVLKKLRPLSALLDLGEFESWCPRSAIEDVLAESQVGLELQLSIAYWKAREWGLA